MRKRSLPMNHRISDRPMIADCDGKSIYHWIVPDSVAAYQDSDGGDGRHCPYPLSNGGNSRAFPGDDESIVIDLGILG